MGNVIAASTPKSSRERKVLQAECREFSLNDINSECCECFSNLSKPDGRACCEVLLELLLLTNSLTDFHTPCVTCIIPVPRLPRPSKSMTFVGLGRAE